MRYKNTIVLYLVEPTHGNAGACQQKGIDLWQVGQQTHEDSAQRVGCSQDGDQQSSVLRGLAVRDSQLSSYAIHFKNI